VTRKDYIALSDTIREMVQTCTDDGRGDIRSRAIADHAVRMCAVLKSDNPRFDADRFLTACNVDKVGYDTGRAWDRGDEVRGV
jgi:hypothetical protein